ncbi:hypothetical protein JB92DRAFT_2834758 [Gautieria morchelliformis]|nr:hypothetical protein JB92DRAFT_2834758 [Gautieria morchelliformis]
MKSKERQELRNTRQVMQCHHAMKQATRCLNCSSTRERPTPGDEERGAQGDIYAHMAAMPVVKGDSIRKKRGWYLALRSARSTFSAVAPPPVTLQGRSCGWTVSQVTDRRGAGELKKSRSQTRVAKEEFVEAREELQSVRRVDVREEWEQEKSCEAREESKREKKLRPFAVRRPREPSLLGVAALACGPTATNNGTVSSDVHDPWSSYCWSWVKLISCRAFLLEPGGGIETKKFADSCRLAIAGKKRQTQPKKKIRTDAAEPADALEDDPPMDWAEDSDVMWVKDFPEPAGVSYGEQKTTFEVLHEEQRMGSLGTFGPFEDLAEWELAEWLIKGGASQSDIDKYLKLDIVNEDVHDYNGERRTEELFILCHNPVDCVKELIGNPAFKEAMHYAPQKVFTDLTEEDQVFNEMWTGEWWWELQEKLSKGATISPIIIASDKTQLSQFSGDKQAWPPSKQAMVLLGYLPVTKLECLSPERRKERAYRLFHYCMSLILEPLIAAGKDGVYITCSDSQIRHIFLILASYIADYPEQCLVAAIRENSCPICTVSPDDCGNPGCAPTRNPSTILMALRSSEMGTPSPALKNLHLRPIPQPFWADLPHTNIFECFTPNLLHQLHKGVFKDHMVKWCIQIAGKGDHLGLRHFKKGIPTISQWTGREHKEMEHVFASLIFGAVPPDVAAVARATIDFIYYASFLSHSTETLRHLQDSLRTFHEHKGIFIKAGIRKHSRIPKIHIMEHYAHLIRAKGSADGFNTEINKKNYTQQMIQYLWHQEAIHKFTAFLTWTNATHPVINRSYDEDGDSSTESETSSMDEPVELISHTPSTHWHIAKQAPMPGTSLQDLIEKHGAMDIVAALAMYLCQYVPNCQITPSTFDCVDVYTRLYIDLQSPQCLNDDIQKDIIRACPASHSPRKKCLVPALFDTALIHDTWDAEEIGLKGYRAARICAIFRLSHWFTNFTLPVEPLQMSQVSYSMHHNRRHGEIVHVNSIQRSCYLTPKFGSAKHRNQTWTSENVLDECQTFFLNSQLSIYMFQMCDGDFVVEKDNHT